MAFTVHTPGEIISVTTFQCDTSSLVSFKTDTGVSLNIHVDIELAERLAETFQQYKTETGS